jgi:long-chain acyl-CoA synthetase
MNIQSTRMNQAARTRPQKIGTQTCPPNEALDTWAESSELNSVPQFFKQTATKNANKEFLGQRVGRGQYEYQTYSEVAEKVDDLSSGLLNLGIQPGDRVATFSDNRPEWLVTDFATMQTGGVHAPLYNTLPDDQVEYILKDSGSKVVFVDDKKRLAQVLKAEGNLSELETIVLMDDELKDAAKASGKNITTFQNLMKSGEESFESNRGALQERLEQLTPQDIASMVYTSGSTGAPKGVLLAHGNWLSGIEGLAQVINDDPEQKLSTYQKHGDVYPSVLPLAHVMGRTTDYFVAAGGSKIAYPGSVMNFKRDLKKISPTMLAVTPLFHQGVYEKVEKAALKQTDSIVKPWQAALAGGVVSAGIGAAAGALFGQSAIGGAIGAAVGALGTAVAAKNISKADAFNFAVNASTDYHEKKAAGDLDVGTKLRFKLAEKVVFSKLKEKVDAQTGGRIELMVSGGAPLDRKLEAFFKSAGFDMRQGYGLSETTGATTVARKDSFGTVGPPLEGTEIKIGKKDEILIKGPGVMAGGYLNRPEKTEKTFNEDGWFKTGDTGSLNEKGELSITGRLKTQFKLPGGKYVRPEPLEDAIKASPYITEAVVMGDTDRDLVGALIVPNFENLEAVAKEKGLPTDPEELAKNKEIQALIKGETLELSKDFPKHERVRAVALLPHGFSVEAGELTPSFKVKRNTIQKNYADAIASMFG